jgi:hypothetical protein
MTRNQDLHILHMDDASAFVDGLNWRIVRNDTLLFDFVYFLHPVKTVTLRHVQCADAQPAMQL